MYAEGFDVLRCRSSQSSQPMFSISSVAIHTFTKTYVVSVSTERDFLPSVALLV